MVLTLHDGYIIFRNEYLNSNSPFAITVTLACPIFCPLSDRTIQVYTILVNSAATVIVRSPCSYRLDKSHVIFAASWSVWHVRVTLSFWHSVSTPNLGDDVIVMFAVVAVQQY